MTKSAELEVAVQALLHDPDTPALEQHLRHNLPVLVYNSRPDISTEAALARLDDALDLIERFTPERFARLGEDFVAILVRRYPCRAAYYPDLRVCVIELTVLVHPEITAAQVGASIVHEAVHARYGGAGIRGGPQAAADEERICRQAEIEFGLRVPGGEAVVERARAALGLADEEVAPAIDWRLAAERVAEADRRAKE
ncbi:MAG: hypothetical protein ABI647_24310 [Gemmatimonadota bacterium]